VKTIKHFWLYLAQFFLEREMFQKTVVEKFKKSMHNIFRNGVIYELMWKNIVQPERWRQQDRLHDVMSQKKTHFNSILIYLFNVAHIPCSILLPTTVISYYYTKLGFALLHISATYFN
jgi:hypothetical protein